MAESTKKTIVKSTSSVEEEIKKGDKLSIIDLVDGLMNRAYISDASDIHIDPEEARVVVRMRIDGVLHDTFVLPKEIQPEVMTRIKVLSNLRTDEHQAAQDGRFRVTAASGESIDIRVSIVPTYYGENAVLRLLAEKSALFTLETIGFSQEDLKKVKGAIERPYGMILATGPTGSGKTTTLYAILKILNTREVSVVTIEDPIEYAVEGINQIQANPRTGLNFATGLRSILRQDPNIIMVGEIRDEETAAIAVNAALTGHLMLSTLHTNDAATTLPRLIDMKVEPFLIASTVNIAIGQRLVRTICPDCKTKKNLTDIELKSITDIVPVKLLEGKLEFYYGKGCNKCDSSGYKGRIGVHEVMTIDEEIREAIMARKNSDQIREIAIKSGMTTMLEDGFKKALAGTTTIEEVLRVVHE
ncbi:MAG: type II/IV secretion system protein [Candidatus Colwellbacteria bacterium]|nr:type II/IV secretion system protein [Candidatus Colwellbacteria bacterium]